MNTKWATKFLLNKIRLSLPPMSQTEKIALEAGSVWWDQEIMGGKPNWNLLFSTPAPSLTQEEKSFIENEVNQACEMVNEWNINNDFIELPDHIWSFIKKKGFLGMIIPKKYGGLEFSAYAQSQILTKLATRSSALSVMVMVPNSLGPGELLLHYGTDKQKDHYLPKLSNGKEVPAFALTSPWAGSDAASIPDIGIICKKKYKGKQTLGVNVTWDKRYITLAPICSVLGLAFHAFDPEGLLGKEKDLGITCALIPAKHPGVEIGNRHMPLSVKWPNGPTKGENVFIPIGFIIGEEKGIGQGWRMLMECLAAGRAISLPSSNAGIAQLTTRTVGGYARIRQQFKTPISNFEGISSTLGEIAGKTFIIDSTRRLAAAAIDSGERPSVISAIAKVHATEKAREVVSAGMDVIGGKGICHGPSNFLAEAHIQTPISITVEGANILTRSLIIFGQGAIRCHPYVLKELKAAQNPNEEEATEEFDNAVKGHFLMVLRNLQRTLLSGLTGARFLKANPKINSECKRYLQHADRFSAAFSLISDYCLLTLGGKLKRKEMISARLGDILSNLFMISACLKNYKDKGQKKEDLAVTIVSCKICLSEIEKAFEGLFFNLPNKITATILRRIVFPWGSEKFEPTDLELFEASKQITKNGSVRSNLTSEVYVNEKTDKEILKTEPVSCIDAALDASIFSEPIEAKIRAAERKGRFINNPLANVRDISLEAFKENVITKDEYEILRNRDELRDMVIHVDVFDYNLKNIISKPEKPLAKAA